MVKLSKNSTIDLHIFLFISYIVNALRKFTKINSLKYMYVQNIQFRITLLQETEAFLHLGTK